MFDFPCGDKRRDGALHRFFEEERELPHTLVIYESPFRVWHTLKAALEVLGDRRAAPVLKELLSMPLVPIDSIYAECGYADPTSLRKAFRKVFRQSPREWRLAHLA